MYQNRLRILLPALLATLGLSSAIHAATFNVTNGTELQAALTQAQNNGEGDTIILAAGTYDASGGTFSYVADNTSGSGENFPLTLQGAGAGATFLDGGNAHTILIIRADNTLPLNKDDNADVTIQGITFQNGHADLFSSGALSIFANNADIALKNCVFLSNNTEGQGAVELEAGEFGGTGNILADGNSFTQNTSKLQAGAAFFTSSAGGIVATNNVFFGNRTDGIAGAVYMQHFSGIPAAKPLQFINNTVVGNSALDNIFGAGGGIFISYDQATEQVDLYNNIFLNNMAGLSGKDVFLFDIVGNTGDPASGTVNLFNNDLSEICFQSSGGCDPAAITGLSQGGEINVDPQLIDPVNGNFNLAAGSPAMNAGDLNAPSLPATDHDGNPRVSGPAPDMGALEAPLPGAGGGGGNGGGSGEPVSGSGCALQGGAPAAWSGLLFSLLLLPLGILRSRRRA